MAKSTLTDSQLRELIGVHHNILFERRTRLGEVG